MDWHKFVEIDPRYYRPTEVDFLMADPSRSKQRLDWEPKVKFHELVRIMVDAVLNLPDWNVQARVKRLWMKNSPVGIDGKTRLSRWRDNNIFLSTYPSMEYMEVSSCQRM